MTGIVTYDFFPFIGGIGRLTHTIHRMSTSQDFLVFSPAANTLSRHVQIAFWPIRFLKQAGVSIWLHLNVRRIITEFGLDRLNVHSGPGGVLLIRRLPIPVIISCHHTYWQQYTYIPSQFWKRIFLPFERRTYRLADRIICDCQSTKTVLMQRYAVPDDKITVIPCAVDTDRFRDTGVPRHDGCLLYVGRIDTRKGIESLITSMPLVVHEFPRARLLIAGTGRDIGKMKSLVHRLHLEPYVTFLGFVPDDQLNDLYNRAQCVVVPSIFEGFGITVIEALASGTRVVGTDVDGIRDILLSGDYGRLAPYGDHRALADAIIAELQDPRRVPSLGKEYTLDHFRRHFSAIVFDTAGNPKNGGDTGTSMPTA
jgi:glycosyltransferase involved in cell wall biosynthesis